MVHQHKLKVKVAFLAYMGLVSPKIIALMILSVKTMVVKGINELKSMSRLKRLAQKLAP